jgi:putative ABC transport system permease protein
MRLDILTALRQIRRAPATTAAAIVTLAIGIGATTAVLTFIMAVLSAATPADDMTRLVGIWSHNRAESETKGLVSAGDYFEWRTRARTIESLSAWRRRSFNVSGAGLPVRIPAQLVTPDYFQTFGWQPLMGRLFSADDARPGAPRVVVLSYTYWQNSRAGNPDVIGQTMRLDGEPATIIGVLPRLAAASDIFVPLVLEGERGNHADRTLFVHGRLAAGATLESARAEMETIGAALEREFAATNRGWSINTRPLQEEFVGASARLALGLLAAIVVTVLVIGCVNIANLLLARGAARRGELAVKLALGAGGWRVVRQLLVECFVLAALGGVLSIAVSRVTLNVLLGLGAVDSPWVANSGLNPRALLFTVVASLLATGVAGLAPALAARRASLVDNMRDGSRSSVGGARRTTRVLVTAQVALAVTLLVVAGLLVRTLGAIQRLDPGFEMDNVLTAVVTLPDAMPADAAARWVEQAVEHARRLPGVVTVGATSRLPFAGSRWNPNRGLEIEGQQAPGDDAGRWAVDYAVTPGLVEALRIRLIEGRTFTAGDGAGAPAVAIVNQAMVRRFWQGRSPLGARLRRGDDPPGQWRTVVGVVADVRNDDADQPPLPYLYVPHAQQPTRTVALALRTSGVPEALIDPLRSAMQNVDGDQAFYDVRSMRQVWEADLESSRVLIQVMGALALVALGLAGLGVWGVTAQSVGQRTREIGLRVALGASPAMVGRLIAFQGLKPIAVGLALGVALGLGAGRVMRSILFQVTPSDPWTLIGTLTALLAVGLVATFGPAIRAARIDPVDALRAD